MVVFLVTATLYLTCTGGAQYEYYHNIAPITVVAPPTHCQIPARP